MIKVGDVVGAIVTVGIVFGVATSAADMVSYKAPAKLSAEAKQCMRLTSQWFQELDPADDHFTIELRVERLVEMQRACLTLK